MPKQINDFWSQYELNNLQINFLQKNEQLNTFNEELEEILTRPTLLDQEQIVSLKKFVTEHKKHFSEIPGVTNVVSHTINTGDSKPIARRRYPESKEKSAAISAEIDKMLQLGLIEESKSPWCSPVHLVVKKDNTYRFCLDYRHLNTVTLDDQFPMPDMKDILNSLQGCKYYTSLDLTMGFWQIPMDQKDIPKTAFACSRGLFHFLRMPFGLKTAPATFNRMMSKVLTPVLGKCALSYLDDVIVFSPTFEQHIIDLKKVFNLLYDSGLMIKLKKSQFCQEKFKFLGCIVRDGKVLIDEEKIESIRTYKAPTNLTETQAFLGLAGWLRRHIKDYAQITRPLSLLTSGKNPKKAFKWTQQCQEAFVATKKAIMNSKTALSLPDFSKEFFVFSDASNNGIGGCLTQEGADGKMQVIEYTSRVLKKAELNYAISEKECLALIFCIHKFRPYIQSAKFTIFTDHMALKWLMKTKDLKGRLCRWSLVLQEFSYEVRYLEGKKNTVADALSRGTGIPAIENEPEYLERSQNSAPSLNLITEIKVNFNTISLNNIKNEQSKEKWIVEMVDKISKSNKTQFKNYLVKDDVLYYYKNDDTNQNIRVVIPRKLVYKVVSEFHDKPSSGHFGIDKTAEKIKKRAFWHKMDDDIELYVKSCKNCQLTKHANKLLKYPMVSNFVSRPLELVSIDYIGPVRRSSLGNSFVLVIIDHYSKWIEAFPLRSSTSKSLCQHVHNFFCRYGVPEKILSDNGPQFLSKLYEDLLRIWSCKQSFTSIRHPQSNPVERQNGILKRLIRSFVDSSQADWDKHMPELLLAMRTTVNGTTNFSPAKLFLGRELRLPWDSIETPAQGKNITVATQVTNKDEEIAKITKIVETNMIKNKAIQKENYDKKTATRSFEVGDKVKVLNYVQSSAEKKITAGLAKKWKGPYTISKKINDLVYELQDSSKKSLGKWNVCQIDKFLDRDPDIDADQTYVKQTVDTRPYVHQHQYNTRSKAKKANPQLNTIMICQGS